MLFDIFFYGCFILPFLIVALALASRNEEVGTVLIVFGFLFGGLLVLLPTIALWQGHAGDLAKISHQSELIKTYQQQVNEIEGRLDSFEYPSGALLNADTPVSAIVASLSEWQGKLADAQAERALAIRDVEKTRLGIFGGVIDKVGDYKGKPQEATNEK